MGRNNDVGYLGLPDFKVLGGAQEQVWAQVVENQTEKGSQDPLDKMFGSLRRIHSSEKLG